MQHLTTKIIHKLQLGNLSAQQFKKMIDKFHPDVYTTAEFSSNSAHIVKLLSTLPSKYTTQFIKKIDSLYTGLSFHFVMEARHHFTKENALFLFRIACHFYVKPEDVLFSPTREKLMRGLLFNGSENERMMFSQIKDSLSTIKNVSFLEKYDKKFFISLILDKSFTVYYNKSYPLIIDNDDEDDEDLFVQ